MKLAISTNAFSLLLSLVHMRKICSSKSSSEPIKTPSSVFFKLNLIEEPPKVDSVGVFELNMKWHFYSKFSSLFVFCKARKVSEKHFRKKLSKNTEKY